MLLKVSDGGDWFEKTTDASGRVNNDPLAPKVFDCMLEISSASPLLPCNQTWAWHQDVLLNLSCAVLQISTKTLNRQGSGAPATRAAGLEKESYDWYANQV